MKFIRVEQFLNQSKEIQEVLRRDWEPEVGDLYYKDGSMNMVMDEAINKEGLIPLFTEGQLRTLIEDVTGYNVECEYSPEKGYHINLIRIKVVEEHKVGQYVRSFDELGHDLLISYWKVLCEMIKETF